MKKYHKKLNLTEVIEVLTMATLQDEQDVVLRDGWCNQLKKDSLAWFRIFNPDCYRDYRHDKTLIDNYYKGNAVGVAAGWIKSWF